MNYINIERDARGLLLVLWAHVFDVANELASIIISCE